MSGRLLDPALNRAPDHPRHIHLIGICGTGMAALASMLQERGYTVTGSDQNVYPPMSDFLARLGIEVMSGYAAANLAARPDLVVVGNVVRITNPEAVELARLGLPYLSMPQTLGHFFLEGKCSLVVAGTHGKTTTSSLLATTLHRLGAGPGFMIGGLVEAFGRNAQVGEGSHFVVEGDEYDTAFFNKVSKFQHYRPNCAILTSVEFDHADIFPDLAAIEASFAEFIGRIPPTGALVACLDDPVVATLAGAARCPVIGYGSGADCEWQLADLHAQGLSIEFTAVHRGQPLGRCTLPMPGRHNGLNALAVIALLHHLGFAFEAIVAGLASFEGVKRRQQIRGVVRGVTVIDDFAHHPTAVRETLHALRLAWPENRLIVVFEPRTNSSRRAVFQAEYARVFSDADQVLIREHVPLDTLPMNEQFSSVRLAADLAAQGLAAKAFPDTEAILAALDDRCREGDVVVILSNGGFDNIHERLLAQLGRSA
ncbi:MAG: UDP-N-acetylmuramate:L-alanyl-gamma-D-glutamyl-meso-diaminopimelate ligase [Desulfobulbus sp.]|jgi:UDP-N-acetylmuramate: L-alanyl-gamma-D-glutamyl-meso-diaminopimelate ligase|uniref:UDP-N-acetylmuramate:L-alanyl-gamma-D-glutamyl- meso-diaminopimelate ligase n=1 Tax=Desulfobulbus sp. TaxID=895 RepID=UPI00284742D6|nr:UDP-N-acetylmuramate:L-alanyl-gamma-D-glutamyl-meso-diaminopimelate ligase [Desulfobulbus sp.]MDR2550285.1 UDP-N-acetylmuramate:L-alanyl-gamma-D-glutamyl-meso-diaminopimelate ligase [Desulfobulbus sp.]